jgi:hypothetical protein
MYRCNLFGLDKLNVPGIRNGWKIWLRQWNNDQPAIGIVMFPVLEPVIRSGIALKRMGVPGMYMINCTIVIVEAQNILNWIVLHWKEERKQAHRLISP